VHAELTHSVPNASYHLLDEAFLRQQRPGCVLINAARGAIIPTQALLASSHLCLCLDTWEHEPMINVQLLQQASIATPHIAGYSRQAKKRAAFAVYRQLLNYYPELMESSQCQNKESQLSSYNSQLSYYDEAIIVSS